MGSENYIDSWFFHDGKRRGNISNSDAMLNVCKVISYVIIASLADAYPTATHFNRGAAIVQVIFIYVIEMVRVP